MSWSVKKGNSRVGPESKKRKLEYSHQGAVADDWDDDIVFTQEELHTLDVIASQAIQQSQPPHVEKYPAPRLSTFSIPGTSKPFSSSSSKESQLLQSSSSRLAGRQPAHHSSSSELSSNGYHPQPKLDSEIKKTKEERDRYAGEVKYLKDVTQSQEVELEKLRAQIEEIKEGHKLTETTKIQGLETVVERVTFEKQFKDREIEELQRQLQSVHQKLRRLEVQNHKNQQQKSNSTIAVQKTPEKVSPKKVAVEPSPPSRKQQALIDNISMSQQQNFPTYHSFIKQKPSHAEVQKSIPNLPGANTLESTSTKSSSRRLKLKIGRLKSSGNLIATRLFQASQSDLKSDLKTQIWDPGLIRLLNDATFSPAMAVPGTRRKEDSFVPRRKFPSNQTNKKPGEWKPQIVTREHYQSAVNGLMFLLDEKTNFSQENQASSKDSSRLLASLPDISEDEAVYKLMNSTQETFLKEQSPTCRALTNILPLLTDYIQHYIHIIESESFRLNNSSSSLSSSNFSSPLSSEAARCSTSVLTESSPGSVGGCLVYLLRGDNGLCGSDIESLATLSLRTLAKLLLLCPAVGQVIFKESVSFSYTTLVSAKELAENAKKRSSSASGTADDEQSTRSSETLYIVDCQSPALVSQGKVPSLLQSFLRLARQDLEHDCTSPLIVNESVKCLTNLIQCLPKQVLYKLEGLLPLHFISASFKQSRCISVHLSALKLLSSLARCEKLLEKLCTKSDNCPLFLAHRICSRNYPEAPPADRVLFHQEKNVLRTLVVNYSCYGNVGYHIPGQTDFTTACLHNSGKHFQYFYDSGTVVYITCKLKIVDHPLGLKLLLTNKCPCTEEMVVAVIRALNEVLAFYKAARARSEPAQQHRLDTLVGGIHLLHALAQGDIFFAQHHSRVQVIYVRLVTELERLFRHFPQDYELILMMLEELNDFDLEPADASQGMDTDEK